MPLHELFALDAPAAPLHELFALDSGAAEPAPVGVVEPPDELLSPPHPASRPTKMPEAAVTARVLPIFMFCSPRDSFSCPSRGPAHEKYAEQGTGVLPKLNKKKQADV